VAGRPRGIWHFHESQSQISHPWAPRKCQIPHLWAPRKCQIPTPGYRFLPKTDLSYVKFPTPGQNPNVENCQPGKNSPSHFTVPPPSPTLVLNIDRCIWCTTKCSIKSKREQTLLIIWVSVCVGFGVAVFTSLMSRGEAHLMTFVVRNSFLEWWWRKREGCGDTSRHLIECNTSVSFEVNRLQSTFGPLTFLSLFGQFKKFWKTIWTFPSESITTWRRLWGRDSNAMG